MSLQPPQSLGGFSTPSFRPTQYLSNSTPTDKSGWKLVLSSPCHFTLSTFFATLKNLSLHPERNSTLILRTDPLPLKGAATVKGNDERTLKNGVEEYGFGDPGAMEFVEEIRVRLMPKQPTRDGKLDQQTLMYRGRQVVSPTPEELGSSTAEPHDHGEEEEGLVILIPEAKSAQEIPYYHPPVLKLAFKWEPFKGEFPKLEEVLTLEDGNPPIRGTISIAYLPFPNSTLTAGARSIESDKAPDSLTPKFSQPGLLNHLSARPARAPRKRSPLAASSTDGTGITMTQMRPPAVMLDSSEAIPSPSSTESVPVASQDAGDVRLHRTCLALLERLYKHGYGSMVGYRKRVEHDVVIPKDNFQDLYLILKDRHRHLDSRASKPGSTKVEDIKRHVFKIENQGLPDDPLLPTHNISEWGQQDVAIAAFLMLLWKEMYPARMIDRSVIVDDESIQEWGTWGRPPGGFVDLGCGNGLLVHILTSEGYMGKGYELRARRTWPLYPPKTQEALVELAIDPLSWFPQTMEEWDTGQWAGQEGCIIKEGTFLIGNHSDELTPWLPLLSLLPHTPSPHLSLPCCLHTLDSLFDLPPTYIPPTHPHTPHGGFEDGLENGASRYKAYLIWLGYCGLRCGWIWEKEGLRIPSTKGWGIVARKRWVETQEEERECRQWVMDEINAVREKGAFKIRIKEGKDH